MKRRASLMIVALALSACAALEPTATTPPTVPPTPPDPATISDREVLSWSIDRGCEEPGGAAFLVSLDNEWVLVDNATARTQLAVEGDVYHLVIRQHEATRVLAGNALVGTALHAETFDVLKRALDAGADVIAGSHGDRPDRPDQPEPQRGYFLVLGDGRAAWTGACGPVWITAPLLAYRDHLGDAYGREVFERLLTRDPDTLAEFTAWYPKYLAERGP